MPDDRTIPSPTVGEFHPVEAKAATDGTWVFTASRGGGSSPVRYLLRLLRPARARPAQEASLAALQHVRHSGLVGYEASGRVDAGVYSESLWLARPLRHLSLANWVRNHRRKRDALKLAIQLASGLEALHANGLSHLDIRPGNIFIHESQWQLADYGIVALTGRWTHRPSQCLYCAPELAVTRDPDHAAADVFSLAAVVASFVAGSPSEGTPSDWIHDVPGPWRERLETALGPDPLQRPTATELRTLFTSMPGAQTGLSARDLDLLMSSSEFHDSVLKTAVRRFLAPGVSPSRLEDATQEVMLRLWTLAHDDPSFCSRFKDDRALRAYALKSIERELWRSESLATRYVPFDVEQQDAIARSSRSPKASPAAALDTLADLEERLGHQPARICRLRMYGRSFGQIAELLSTARDRWTATDAFITLVRLERAYPELRRVLPEVPPEEAGRLYAVWLKDQVPADAIPLISMRLAGYSIRQIAHELEISTASVSSRLFRLKRSEPALSLLLDHETLWPTEVDAARRILSLAEDGALYDFDPAWTTWMRQRAQAAFEQASSVDRHERAADAASRILRDFSLANEVRARVLAEPSRTAVMPADQKSDDLLSQIDASTLVAFGVGEDAQIPLFQLNESGLVRHVVAAVNETLGARSDPYGVFYWWIEPNSRLSNRAPVELLESGTDEDELRLLQLAQATVDPD